MIASSRGFCTRKDFFNFGFEFAVILLHALADGNASNVQ